MANFTIPNLCGASPELNLASTKIADLENEITSKLDAVASEAAAAFDSALADVKDGLDGLALDLPEVPNVNFQAEITSLINDIDKTTLDGITAFNNKLAELEKDFGETLKEKGLELDKLITDATSAIGGGGDVCALAPNLEIPAASSGTGVTTQELNERVSNAATITLTQIPKEILEVQGKKTNQTFFTNISYSLNGRIVVPKQTGTYSEIKVKYTVSLIKEKPVEVKQASAPPDIEEVSTIVKNVKVETIKESLKTKQQDIDTGEIFTKPDETGFVKKADIVKDVEPVVTKTGGTITATTPTKSNIVTTETITTPSGGGYTITRSAPVTKRKVQSDKGLTTRVKNKFEYFVLKGSINETFWSDGGRSFSGGTVKKHKVIDDFSKVTLKFPFNDIKSIKVSVEQRAIDLTATKTLAYYGRYSSMGYKRLDYVSKRKGSKQKLNEIDYELPTETDQKLLELIDYETGQPLSEGTRMKVRYTYLEKYDPNFSG